MIPLGSLIQPVRWTRWREGKWWSGAVVMPWCSLGVDAGGRAVAQVALTEHEGHDDGGHREEDAGQDDRMDRTGSDRQRVRDAVPAGLGVDVALLWAQRVARGTRGQRTMAARPRH